jgi:hypothetical protein
MMPLCTGLPPGEFMRITTAVALGSSNAVLRALIKCSALASPSALISPRTSIKAVCGPLGAPVTWLRVDSSDHAMSAKNANHASLKNARQRRSVRRSFKYMVANFSSADSMCNGAAEACAAEGVEAGKGGESGVSKSCEVG